MVLGDSTEKGWERVLISQRITMPLEAGVGCEVWNVGMGGGVVYCFL